MDAATLTKLLSPEGWALLGALPPYDEQQALVLAAGLRAKGVDPDLAAAALTQSRLRAAARGLLRRPLVRDHGHLHARDARA